VAELNSTMIGASGCTIGGDVPDELSGGGFIAGYNVYRVPGFQGQAATPIEFMGNWQYYIDMLSFDLTLADSPGVAGPDQNDDGLPDGDGTPAANDRAPNDLAGLHNPDGIPYSGDEVILFQDSALNPDRSPRTSGTGPERQGQGYWYAFQPVLFQGSTTNLDYDGTGFTRGADEFVGMHSVDTDADGIFESLDLDLDGQIDFYSPQLVTGQTGLGLTNRGLPVLSAPVFGRADPAAILTDPRLDVRVFGSRVELLLETGLETTDVAGFEVYKESTWGGEVLLHPGRIPANGGEGNVYRLQDRLATWVRRATAPIVYHVDVIHDTGTRLRFGPFEHAGSATSSDQRRR